MRDIVIFTGKTRTASVWEKETTSFEKLCIRLSKPVRGKETVAEYQAMDKGRKNGLKDVGGFVGGSLENGIRSKSTVEFRDLITIDMDSVSSTDEFKSIVSKMLDNDQSPLSCSYCYYTTRSYTPSNPRFRLVVPLDRSVNSDEYQAVARKFCELVGLLDFCDPTTFDPSRLMYWGSACSDGNYICNFNTSRDWLIVDSVLSEYDDWRDCTSLPKTKNEKQQTCTEVLKKKAEDPQTKSGWIGAFCNTYNIHEAISAFLHNVYTQGSTPDRYTYTKGSTTDGAIVYDNGKFLYSNHATDPVAGRSVNAFDLVRIHVFGEKDSKKSETQPVDSLPSYKAMIGVCQSLKEVRMKKAEEKLNVAQAEFMTGLNQKVENMPEDLNAREAYLSEKIADNSDIVDTVSEQNQKQKQKQKRTLEPSKQFPKKESPSGQAGIAQARRSIFESSTKRAIKAAKKIHDQYSADLKWLETLACDKKGNIISGIANIYAILKNNPYFKGRLKRDTFADIMLAEAPMPWQSRSEAIGTFEWDQDDYVNLRLYCSKLGIKCSNDDIRTAVAAVMSDNSYDGLNDYILSLRGKWDKVPRVDTYFIDTLGADDTYYVRMVTRKQILAMVARALCPGIKYDTMLILYGQQGIGKSTALRRLARFGHREQDQNANWYLNMTGSMEGREFAEKLQGQWVVELSELNSLNKSDSDKIKDCLSSCFDSYRKPYDICPGKKYRRCIFFGTTNDMEFLKDPTGRRRFNPIMCKGNGIINVFDMKDEYIDQIFAEALEAFENGEPLETSVEFNATAEEERKKYDIVDPIETYIIEYLNTEFPCSWYRMSLAEQRRFLDDPNSEDFANEAKMQLNAISITELWIQALRKDKYSITLIDKKRIKNILLKLGWEVSGKNSRTFGELKSQKFFTRPQAT